MAKRHFDDTPEGSPFRVEPWIVDGATLHTVMTAIEPPDDPLFDNAIRAWTTLNPGKNMPKHIADQPYFNAALIKLGDIETTGDDSFCETGLGGEAWPSMLTFATHCVVFCELDESVCSVLSSRAIKAEMVYATLVSADDFVDDIMNFLRPHGMENPVHWSAELAKMAGDFLVTRTRKRLNVRRPAALHDVRQRLIEGIAPVMGITVDPHGDLIKWADS